MLGLGSRLSLIIVTLLLSIRFRVCRGVLNLHHFDAWADI